MWADQGVGSEELLLAVQVGLVLEVEDGTTSDEEDDAGDPRQQRRASGLSGLLGVGRRRDDLTLNVVQPGLERLVASLFLKELYKNKLK